MKAGERHEPPRLCAAGCGRPAALRKNGKPGLSCGAHECVRAIRNASTAATLAAYAEAGVPQWGSSLKKELRQVRPWPRTLAFADAVTRDGGPGPRLPTGRTASYAGCSLDGWENHQWAEQS